MCASCMAIHARAVLATTDSVSSQMASTDDKYLVPLDPTYLDRVVSTGGWDANWFVEARGGASAFLGKPLGCSDLWGRLKPTMQVGIGKWFTPTVGARVAFQGFELKDANLQTQSYQSYHADFLFNLTGNLNTDAYGVARWDVVPYVGTGIIRHAESGRKPFALHYGLMARYHVSHRLHLTAELGGLTTFQDFDGTGDAHKFGDNMLTLSVGASLTIGKVGWKRIVDAKPYMEQNEWLLQHCNDLQRERYASKEDNVKSSSKDYSGLASLRARLAHKGWDGNGQMAAGDSLSTALWDAYLAEMRQGKTCIGAPVYFFFVINTTKLNDASQLLNVEELAKVAKQYDLKVRVTGAADAATGTEPINDKLSKQRAIYLAKLLKRYGVKSSNITTYYEGGIDEYQPDATNRHTKVEIGFF